jgi:DNA-directed RNA polymerase specialized sigma24 family protein
MSSVGSLTRYVQELRSPDGRMRDEAARVIWERFAPRLKLLVRRHLDHRIFRREDEQDILQCMFASFCESQSKGSRAPASREELWKLLVRITMCKVVNAAHRHQADRRDIRRERGEPSADPEENRFPQWMLEHVDRATPSAEERIAAVEEIQRLLQLLPGDLRQIVVWRLEGFTNADIAAMIGLTLRSVEMKLQIVRKKLAKEFGAIEPSGRGKAPRDQSLDGPAASAGE